MWKMVDWTWFYSVKPPTCMTVVEYFIILTTMREQNRLDRENCQNRVITDITGSQTQLEQNKQILWMHHMNVQLLFNAVLHSDSCPKTTFRMSRYLHYTANSKITKIPNSERNLRRKVFCYYNKKIVHALFIMI